MEKCNRVIVKKQAHKQKEIEREKECVKKQKCKLTTKIET